MYVKTAKYDTLVRRYDELTSLRRITAVQAELLNDIVLELNERDGIAFEAIPTAMQRVMIHNGRNANPI